MENDYEDFAYKQLVELAEKDPGLCDESGRAFWPIPLTFAEMQARLLLNAQQVVNQASLDCDEELADKVASIRMRLSLLSHEGDIGENHIKLFRLDHPAVVAGGRNLACELPFASFVSRGMTRRAIDSLGMLFFRRLGFFARGEEIALGETKALSDLRMIKPDGCYSKVHLQEEVEHGIIAREIKELADSFSGMAGYVMRRSFWKGVELHDELYRGVVKGWQGV